MAGALRQVMESRNHQEDLHSHIFDSVIFGEHIIIISVGTSGPAIKVGPALLVVGAGRGEGIFSWTGELESGL